MEPSLIANRLPKIALIVNLVLLDAGVIYLVYKSQAPNLKSQISSNVPIIQNIDQCGAECQKYIDSRLAQFSTPFPTPTPISPLVPKFSSPTTAVKPKTRAVSYVTVPGSGNTSTNDWTALSGTDFYFNAADYPGLVEVYFEANIRLFNGNGAAYVRLFDVTHGIGVQGSEVQTSSQTVKIVESGKVTFWSGKNLIRVQAKSLTADTAVFDSGRLRIVTEN